MYIYIYIYYRERENCQCRGKRLHTRNHKSGIPSENATESPLDNSSENPPGKWQSFRTYHWKVMFFFGKLPPKVHWKTPLKIHNDFWSVDFWRAIFAPVMRHFPTESLFSCILQRIVTCPVDFHWNYSMDFQWHFPTELHFCDFWCAICCSDTGSPLSLSIYIYNIISLSLSLYYIYIYIYLFVCP